MIKQPDPNLKGKGKGSNGKKDLKKNRPPIASTSTPSSSSSEESDSLPSKPKPRKRSKLRHSHSSSSLSSLSGKEGGGYESSSSLSSADEDYFSGKLGKSRVVEGAAVCVRDVAAEEGGDMSVVSSEEVVRGNLDAYILNCESTISSLHSFYRMR